MNDTVCIIVLNFNQTEYTINCVESILKNEYWYYNILLVDNGSKDDNFRELQNGLQKNDKINLHRIDENRGYVGGINYGLEEGAKLNPGYFLILNNDTLIDEKAIIELLKTCKDYSNRAIVSGKVYHYAEPQKLQDIGRTLKNSKILTYHRPGLDEIYKGQYNEVKERDMLDDVFWLFSAELYKAIGGYSPHFWFNAEQADFALRAQKVGYKLIFTPNAKLWHKGSASIGGRDLNPKAIYFSTQSSLILRYKHLNKCGFAKYYYSVLLSVFRTLLKSFLLLVMKNDNRLLFYAFAKFHGFMYFNKWLCKKNINVGYIPKFIK